MQTPACSPVNSGSAQIPRYSPMYDAFPTPQAQRDSPYKLHRKRTSILHTSKQFPQMSPLLLPKPHQLAQTTTHRYASFAEQTNFVPFLLTSHNHNLTKT